MSLRALLLVLLPVLFASSPAWAANHNHLGAGRAGESLFLLDSPELLPAGTWMVRGTWSVADEPVVCSRDKWRAAAIPSEHIVAGALAWGLNDAVELSGGVPVLISNFNLGAANRACGSAGGRTGPRIGLNDPELRLRFRLLETEVFRVTAKTGARLPVGTFALRDARAMLGDLFGAGFAGVTAGARWRGLLAVAELGANVRWPSPIVSSQFGTELTFGAGVEADLGWDLAGTAELSGRITEVEKSDGSEGLQIGLEALAGLQYRAGAVEVTFGAGGGVLPGYGVPHARVVSSIAYLFEADFRQPIPLVSLRDLLLKKDKPDEPRPPQARPKEKCPPPGSREARLFVIPGCPQPPAEEAPDDDDVDALVDEVLEECPVCGRKDAHTHELAVVVHLYFAHDVATLSDAERSRLLRELKSPPRGAQLVQVEVRAHADASGADAYNEALSARRAAHVAELLVWAGVPAAAVKVDAKGARDPLVEDGLHESNRRVRVELRYVIEREAK